jgi:hypothetical protein
VLQVLGKGGFGIVFRAFDEALQRVVAVKVLSPHLAATSPARKRFLREARSSAKVRHENIVQVYAVEEQPLPYLVMEFIPGETLQQRVDRIGPLETAEVVQIGRQIAQGLAAAHAMGLIHRDIKPANILIEAGPHLSGTEIPVCRSKISDFGLARAADDASMTQSGTVAGTPMYMAPEQAHGDTLDHRADLFSLGSVLYTICSGRPPFRASTTLAVLKRVAEDTPRPIPDIIPEVPPWLCDLISRLQAKKPEDRIGTAQEVADLLERGLAERQRPGKAPSTPEAAPAVRRPFRTGRWAAAAAAALLLLLFGGLGITEATGVTNVRGTVIRLFSPEGTLVVEVDDPGVSVKIDGSDIVIRGAGAQEIRLKPGSYAVEASKDGKVVSQELVTVTRGGKQVVRVSQEAPPLEARVKGVGAATTDPDRRAAEYVLSIGGKVSVNGQGGPPISAAAELPKEAFRLTYVFIWGKNQVTDADVAVFKDCKHLNTLDLASTSVTDAGLAQLKDCKILTYLNLAGTRVTDDGLAHLKDCNNLNYLNLDGLPITDAGLAHLKNCKSLSFLGVHNTKVTDDGLAHLKDCANLRAIALEGTRVTDAGLAHLAGLDNLTELHLTNTQVTDKGVEGLAKALPKCKIEWDGGVIKPVRQ